MCEEARKAFENCGINWNFTRNPSGQYANPDVQHAFVDFSAGYKAAIDSMPKPTDEDRIMSISAYHALVGYLSALEGGHLVTVSYVDRLYSWYLPNIEKALGINGGQHESNR